MRVCVCVFSCLEWGGVQTIPKGGCLNVKAITPVTFELATMSQFRKLASTPQRIPIYIYIYIYICVCVCVCVRVNLY